jgi:hypothetical protein
MVCSNRFLMSALVAAAIQIVGAQTAAALDLNAAPSPVTVGDTVVFTVSDPTPALGFDAGSNFYLVDLDFHYAAAELRYLGAATPNADALLIAPDLSLADPDPAGHLLAQYVGNLPVAGSPLFTLSFQALQPSTATLALSLPDGGAYGTSGSVFDTVSAAARVTTVPEPGAATMVAAGLAALALRQHRRPRRSDRAAAAAL